MKRFAFIGSLFGFGALAKAQNYELVTQKVRPKDRSTLSLTPNKSCPVCGTKADKLPVSWGYGMDTDIPTNSQTVVRCKRCNAAFWQDAEE